MSFDDLVLALVARVADAFDLDMHPQQLIHEFDGETERRVDELELGGSG